MLFDNLFELKKQAASNNFSGHIPNFKIFEFFIIESVVLEQFADYFIRFWSKNVCHVPLDNYILQIA